MNLPTFNARRRFSKAMGVLTSLAVTRQAWAAWPDRPLRLIVPSAAGGSPDIACRILAAELSKSLGQAVVVDNKPGAGGNIGIQEITRAAGDGYTIGYGNVGTLAINKSLFAKLPYDAEKQLTPVAFIGFVQNALVVRNDLGVKSVQELIALARSKPGRLVMGSAGNGTTGHLGGELFKSMTRTFITHVPYRGSPQAIQDLLGGQVDLMFDNLSSIAPHIKAGRVLALAVSGKARSPLFPELPTLGQAGVTGYETTAWGGIVAPVSMPRDLVAALNREINQVLAKPEVIAKFAAISFELSPGPPNAIFDLAARESPMWADVIKRSGAKVD